MDELVIIPIIIVAVFIMILIGGNMDYSAEEKKRDQNAKYSIKCAKAGGTWNPEDGICIKG